MNILNYTFKICKIYRVLIILIRSRSFNKVQHMWYPRESVVYSHSQQLSFCDITQYRISYRSSGARGPIMVFFLIIILSLLPGCGAIDLIG